MDNQTYSLKEIFNKLKLLVAEQLEVRIEDIELDSSFRYDLGADELDIVELTMPIEEEFDIEIPDEVAEQLDTVGKTLEYLLSCKNYDLEGYSIKEILVDREKTVKIINFIINSKIEEQKLLEIIDNSYFISHQDQIREFLSVLAQPQTQPTEIVKFIDILNNQFIANNLEFIKKIITFLDNSSLTTNELSKLIHDGNIKSYMNQIEQLKQFIEQTQIEIQNKEAEQGQLQNEIKTLISQKSILEEKLKNLEEKLKNLLSVIPNKKI